jgi:hypothetical protein
MPVPPLRLSLFVGFPSYGGNGGIASEHPAIREWWADLRLKIAADPRIERVVTKTYNDTPITMIRNRMVVDARDAGCHLLMMVDSDQDPQVHKDEADHVPFWDAAFPEIYNHYQKGPLVIGAPYCGTPGCGENVYVFFWESHGTRGIDETPVSLEQYPRTIAAQMRGVQECGALPTGLILYDMRAFELIEPSPLPVDEALELWREGKIDKGELFSSLQPGWFRYEWTTHQATKKGSTEDVQNTRDIGMAGQLKLGYNPLRCAWSSWIGHFKPWCVGRPDMYTAAQATGAFRRAVERGDPGSLVDVSTLPCNKDVDWASLKKPSKTVVGVVGEPLSEALLKHISGVSLHAGTHDDPRHPMKTG